MTDNNQNPRVHSGSIKVEELNRYLDSIIENTGTLRKELAKPEPAEIEKKQEWITDIRDIVGALEDDLEQISILAWEDLKKRADRT